MTTTTRQQNIILGAFDVVVEALEGWARVCPHDKYEIEFRLDRQRHVTAVSIGRDAQHNVWRNRHFTLTTSHSHSDIAVRVRELKSGWTRRHVTLGVTSVHTRDLMSRGTRPQLISLLANNSGSLKLKLCVWWTPSTATLDSSGRAVRAMVDRCDTWSPISRLSIHDNIMKSLTSLMFSDEDVNSNNSGSDVNSSGAHCQAIVHNSNCVNSCCDKRTVF